MADNTGYRVEPAAIDRLGTDITALAPSLTAQSGPWSAAVAGLATGDAGLDEETRQVAQWMDRVLRALAGEAGRLGGKVGQAMTAYRDSDEQVAASFRAIGGAAPPSA